MSELAQPSQIQLDQLFQAVVAEYDAIAPKLVAAGIPMTMKRALQAQDTRSPIMTRDNFLAATISAQERHCIASAYMCSETLLSGAICIEELPDIKADMTKKCTNSNVPDYERLTGYLELYALKAAADMMGIVLYWPPHEDLLAAMLKTPKYAPK